MDQISFTVRVSCFTYNHASYIVDAMNGFTMQQTSFPFVCTIIDDASTDGEQMVIKNYLNEYFDIDDENHVRQEETDDYFLTFARHKTNLNCYFAVLYLKYNHYSIKKSKLPYIAEWNDNAKYIATCEGDDYWIDSSKLQRQFDILDKNPNIYMVYSDYQTVNEKGEDIYRPEYNYYKSLSHSGDILPTLFKSNFPLTLTVMLRREVFSSTLYKNSPHSFDFLYFMSAAFLGDAVFLPEKTGSYRLSPNGLMQTKQKMIKDMYRKVYPYVALEYVKGHSKKMKVANDIITRHTIMRKAWNTYPFLIKDILKIKPLYSLFLVSVIVEKIICRLSLLFSKSK